MNFMSLPANSIDAIIIILFNGYFALNMYIWRGISSFGGEYFIWRGFAFKIRKGNALFEGDLRLKLGRGLLCLWGFAFKRKGILHKYSMFQNFTEIHLHQRYFSFLHCLL